MEALSKLINAMKDLEDLACEHNTQARLYKGDYLERIYKMLGNNDGHQPFVMTPIMIKNSGQS